ncbi:UDP-glucose/GDP-mannose dehydrogenase family protein [Kocuria sp. cx-455]|uniref:UDP-glucose dehydrogenase family protein n=1 Tax=Kocuria sp. cx-455 TaxID=2771377 RepID=UPI001683F34B|nr:UDP-glucose/GDP-mannose dehydrogenase family protein [Kocuria sp. cx-455]MBD2765038.1 UDP-glucose/GDP-mannose dehydrogenase family protein [Kocuria sp. cx-455]
MKLTVIGTGYLGATHAVSMAELGHEVIGLDVDQAKIDALSSGEVPFHEPGLPELLTQHIGTGKLRFTTSYEQAVPFGDVHFIGVGTPQKAESHAADMRYVDAAVTQIARAADRDCIIVGKSTVPVGSAARLQELARENAADGVRVTLVWNPEFLREGHAVEDTLTPDRMVLGLETDANGQYTEEALAAEKVLREVYASQLAADIPLIVTDYQTAELVKVAANSFLATKISFINALSEITETVGGDIRTLADAIGLDERIGRKFLNAGVGFGGGCLPKDIRALRARAAELGVDQSVRFLAEVDDINLRRREHTVQLAVQQLGGSVHGRDIAVLGAAFKPESDDVRDSPALDIAARLHSMGAEVHVYDPQANANAAKRYPRLDYVDRIEQAVARAEMVLLLTEWKEFRELTPEQLEPLVRERTIVDGRNVLDPEQWIDAGWKYMASGRSIKK